MQKRDRDEVREERIEMEIIVDTYNSDECAMGWYCYLEDTLKFPFVAKLVQEGTSSALKTDEIVTVLRMADEDYCMGGMFAWVKHNGDEFGVPLEQLYPVEVNDGSIDKTNEAIADWRYWDDMGYVF